MTMHVLTAKRLYTILLFFASASLLFANHPLVAASPPRAPGEWWTEFFANQFLGGSPILTRFDPVINFNWGTGSPGAEVPADGFSARWTRQEWFDNGTYRFSARSDDGMRVWVGDLLVIDAWFDQQAGWINRDLYVSQGTYPVRVEYYEHAGGAQIFLQWERISGGQGWRAEYFGNQDLAGKPILVRTDAAIDFDWGVGSPDPAVPADRFSVRWTYTLGFTAGTYRFLTSTDDGVRLWVDGHLVVDAWIKQMLPNTHSGDVTLGDGLHHVTVEYFEQGGDAHAHVWWQRLNGFAGWRGEYFDNPNLIGGPALVRDDAEIGFDWDVGPPAPWMPDDNFSARWTREVTFDPGYYRFSVQADDGVRVWLDDALIIDQWREMNYELHYVDGMYLSGPHRIKVAFFERTGHARIRFWIDPASPRTPAPAPVPFDPPAPSDLPPQGPWQASYFTNSTLEGEAALIREEAAIDFDWRLGTPDPALPADYFSARWQTTLDFAAGRYRFTTYTDDGFRLFLDGQPIMGNWLPMRGYRSTVVDLTAGAHTLVMEYFERTGAALARLSWTRADPSQPALAAPASGAPGPWRAEFFDNPGLTGEPLLTQTHEALSFDWGFAAPAPELPKDDFSIRWTTQQHFDAGRYTFSTYSDDGVRLYVDGRRVINSWRPMRGHRSATLDLPEGEHTIVLEYFEHAGIALVRLNWQP